jgi:hypothetical protein
MTRLVPQVESVRRGRVAEAMSTHLLPLGSRQFPLTVESTSRIFVATSPPYGLPDTVEFSREIVRAVSRPLNTESYTSMRFPVKLAAQFEPVITTLRPSEFQPPAPIETL